MAEIAELKNKIAEVQATNEIAELKSQIAEIKSLLGFDEPDVSTHEEPEADELTQEEIDILQVEIAKLQAQLEEQVKE